MIPRDLSRNIIKYLFFLEYYKQKDIDIYLEEKKVIQFLFAMPEGNRS